MQPTDQHPRIPRTQSAGRLSRQEAERHAAQPQNLAGKRKGSTGSSKAAKRSSCHHPKGSRQDAEPHDLTLLGTKGMTLPGARGGGVTQGLVLLSQLQSHLTSGDSNKSTVVLGHTKPASPPTGHRSRIPSTI